MPKKNQMNILLGPAKDEISDDLSNDEDRVSSESLTLVTLDSTPAPEELAMPPSTAENFIVSPSMVDALSVLGINRKVGAIVTLDDFKHAYRKGCLRTHPDKTHTDSEAEFNAVTAAYDTILSIINKEVPSHSTYASSSLSLYEQMVALRKETDEEIKKWQQISEDVRRQRSEVKELKERLNIVMQEQASINAAMGLPELTPEDVAAFQRDPEYFQKKAQREAVLTQRVRSPWFFADVTSSCGVSPAVVMQDSQEDAGTHLELKKYK